jgi:endonuclease/exonuclease/phosphatase family metal-dependent hydrolase
MLRISRILPVTALLAVAAMILGLVVSTQAAHADSTPAPGITVPSTTVLAGSPVTFTFTAPASQVSSTNWIGWYQIGQTPGDVASTYWQYVANSTTGTSTFTGMAPGSYEVYFLYNDGYDVIGSPLEIDVVASLPPVTVTQSGKGTASYSPAKPQAGDTVTLSQQAADGYHFTGWQVTSPSDGSLTIGADGTFTMPSTPVSVQAVFAPATYTVHYDGNGADAGTMTDGSFTYDQAAALASNAFTRTGYHFAGWATEPDGKPTYSDAASVSDLTTTDQSTVTLYAVWHADVATGVAVPSADVLDVDFGSGAPVDHAQGLTATTVGAPTVADDSTFGTSVATFNGTSDAYQYDFSSQYSKLTSHYTVECQFRWNGAALSTLSSSAFPSICSDEQSAGMNIEVYQNKLNASVYIGSYKYAYASATAVTPGVWYDAIATFDGANLKFYLDGQLVATTAAAGTMKAPSATTAKWTLGGDTNSSGGVEAFAPVSLGSSRIWSSVLTADQVAAEAATSTTHAVTVTLSGQGTASASPASAGAGQTVTLSRKAATGYHFTGWQVVDPTDGSIGIGTDGTFTMPDVPVTLSAVFAPNSYTVHFDGNGADGGTMADQSFDYDQTAPLTADAYTKTGSHFAGWATTAGGRPVYADAASVSDLTAKDGDVVTLYAVWVPDGQHLVEVDGGAHGTASSQAWSAAPGDTVAVTATPDTGYHFAGWHVVAPADGSLTVAADGTFTMPDQDVEVAAAFAPDTYTVHFDGNGADGGTMADQPLTYDQTAPLTANAFWHDGFVFQGWSTTPDGAVAYGDAADVTNLTAKDGDTVTLYAQWSPLQVEPGSWPSLSAGFVTDTFKLPMVASAAAVQQSVVGLWNGSTAPTFTKVAGDSWLSVSADGVVSGTAPASSALGLGTITVSATDGTTTAQLLVEVPVAAAGAGPQLATASWNAWGGGSNVTDAVGKNLAVLAAQGLGVIGFQDGGKTMAQQVAEALGWYSYGAGDVGIVSAYPIAKTDRVAPTADAPATAATVTVAGRPVRVWDALLDESSATDRDAQAQAVATAVQGDLAGTAPVVLLGDLASSSEQAAFTAVGLKDSFREANPDATATPGDTLLFADPSDRVDYVDYAGSDVKVQESHTLTVGWPSATAPAGNSWASDHAAVVTSLQLGQASPAAPAAPTATVATTTIGYQVGHGPADAAAFLQAIGAAADPSDATVTADLGSADFSTAGWYTVLVTATEDGVTSDPVAVTVRVAPVPGLVLGATSAAFPAGATIDEAAVLAQLEPSLDVPGAVHVDLSSVAAAAAGSYPVVVTATDDWGFSVTQKATVVVTASTVTVTGTVTGDGGTPVAGACVYLYTDRSAASASYASCTRADGGFAIAGVTPGSYTVAVADPSGHYQTFWSPAAVTVDGSAPLALTVSAATTGNVTGTVADANGPVAGACVYLYAHGVAGQAAYASCTDAQGRYGLYGIATGSYEVAFFDPAGSHPTQWWTGTTGGAATQSGAVAVKVDGGATVTTDATLAVSTDEAVAGTVTDANGPVAGACVYLYAVGDSSAAAYATCTGADGTYWIGHVPAGTGYKLAVSDPSGTHLTQWWTGTAGGAATFDAGAQLPATPGGTVAASATLAPVATGGVAGTVTDTSGAAVGGACVYLYPAGDDSAAAYATCALSDGTYRLDGVAPGDYQVAFFDPTAAHATQWWTGTTGGAATQAGAATVTIGQSVVTGTDARLGAASAG